MMRSCMMHHFNPDTHRCRRCGRWERGHKPKCEPVKPRAECQICERQQALDVSGSLGHHGYTRPGCGWIQGDCCGVGHRPYPATDALEVYQVALDNHIARFQERLAAALTLTQLPFEWSEYIDRKQVARTTMIVKGEPLPRCGNYCVPDFASLLERHVARLEREIASAKREMERVEARIEKAGEV